MCHYYFGTRFLIQLVLGDIFNYFKVSLSTETFINAEAHLEIRSISCLTH